MRCREDYVRVGEDAGGTVWTFCEDCPIREHFVRLARAARAGSVMKTKTN